MCHNINNNNVLNYNQQGSSLVIAIFILVVMSLLGASIINMLRTNEQTFAYEVLGTRAYAAAQSGAQWQLQQIFPLSLPTQINHCTTIRPIPNFSAADGLGNCRISQITCSSLDHEGTTYFKIKSTGQCDINGEKTSRTVEVEAKSID